MLRIPEPQIGQPLDESFVDRIASAIALNPAVHDGAVMLGRKDMWSGYRITGWSYRLFPADGTGNRFPNRGSAFNSCLAMSSEPGVDRLYMINRVRAWRFENGLATELEVFPSTRG
jgi:hypothetical protein